jgi:hypothetical protein
MFPTVRRNLLLQLDGKLPNLALMRLSACLKQRGESIDFRRISSSLMLEHGFFDEGWTSVYASLIFERTRPVAERLRQIYPGAIIGGTGWDRRTRLEQIGVTTQALDYSLYPDYPHSIGFSQRGCRLRCPFCVVPDKEGRVTEERTIAEIWRGDPSPRNVLLLDNDFFGAPQWRERVAELRDGRFRVCFSQVSTQDCWMRRPRRLLLRCGTTMARSAVAASTRRGTTAKTKPGYSLG